MAEVKLRDKSQKEKKKKVWLPIAGVGAEHKVQKIGKMAVERLRLS